MPRELDHIQVGDTITISRTSSHGGTQTMVVEVTARDEPPAPCGAYIDVEDEEERLYRVHFVDAAVHRFYPGGRSNSRGTISTSYVGDLLAIETADGGTLRYAEQSD